MDRTTTELAAIEEVVKEASEDSLRELSECQLAFLGGGTADPIYF